MPDVKLITGPKEVWLQDLAMFMSQGDAAMGYRDPFFRNVAVPLLRTIRALSQQHDEAGVTEALKHLENCGSADLRRWAQEWRERQV